MKPLAPFFCAAALVAAGGAAAQTAQPQDADRMLEFELREDGQLVATPTVRIQAGRPGAVTVGGYSLRFRVDRAAAGAGGPAPWVIRSSLYRAEGGWTRLASPVLTVAEGEQASARFAGSDGSDMSLAVLVR